MKENLRSIIQSYFPKIAILSIEDTSLNHAGHGHGFEKNSHFEIYLSGEMLSSKEKLHIHKTLTILFASFYSKNEVHSISIMFK